MARRCVEAWLRRESAVVVLRIEADTGTDTAVDIEVEDEAEDDYWSIHLALLCLY
jgi:hypothetical protein